MDVTTLLDQDGKIVIELGCAIVTLPRESAQALQKGIQERLARSGSKEQQQLHKKLGIYKRMIATLVDMDDVKMQEFLRQVKAESVVVMAKVSASQAFYNKVSKNMPRQTRRAFEEDFLVMKPVTIHQAVNHIESVIPNLKSLIR